MPDDADELLRDLYGERRRPPGARPPRADAATLGLHLLRDFRREAAPAVAALFAAASPSPDADEWAAAVAVAAARLAGVLAPWGDSFRAPDCLPPGVMTAEAEEFIAAALDWFADFSRPGWPASDAAPMIAAARRLWGLPPDPV